MQNLYFVGRDDDGQLMAYGYEGTNTECRKALLFALEVTRNADKGVSFQEVKARERFLEDVLAHIQEKYEACMSGLERDEEAIKKIMPDFPTDFTEQDWKGFFSFDPSKKELTGRVIFFKLFT
jgi:hypothetical protein